MCMPFKSQPDVVPLALYMRPDGLIVLEHTLAVAKVASKRSGGDHYSSRSFRFPLHRWVSDPNFLPGSHEQCLHFAPLQAATNGELDDYGSHILICLPSSRLWGEARGSGKCWHDERTLPVACLACDAGDSPETLALPEFWQYIELARAKPGKVILPNGRDFLSKPQILSSDLWRSQKLLGSGAQ